MTNTFIDTTRNKSTENKIRKKKNYHGVMRLNLNNNKTKPQK